MTAVDPASGQVLWTFAFGPVSDIGGQLAVAGGIVYVTTTNGEIFALSAANGAKRHKLTGFGEFGAGTIAAATASSTRALTTRRARSPRSTWHRARHCGGRALGPATFAPYVATSSGIIFAGIVNGGAAEAQSGKLYALNAKTGKQLWSQPVTGGVNEGPVAAAGVIYTGGGTLDSGILEAWQPATGKKLWSYTTTDSMGNITVVPGSRVYFGSGGYVYSLGA